MFQIWIFIVFIKRIFLKFELFIVIMGKPLISELVLARSKSENLQNVKNLNLWGNDLEDMRLLR